MIVLCKFVKDSFDALRLSPHQEITEKYSQSLVDIHIRKFERFKVLFQDIAALKRNYFKIFGYYKVNFKILNLKNCITFCYPKISFILLGSMYWLYFKKLAHCWSVS